MLNHRRIGISNWFKSQKKINFLSGDFLKVTFFVTRQPLIALFVIISLFVSACGPRGSTPSVTTATDLNAQYLTGQTGATNVNDQEYSTILEKNPDEESLLEKALTSPGFELDSHVKLITDAYHQVQVDKKNNSQKELVLVVTVDGSNLKFKGLLKDEVVGDMSYPVAILTHQTNEGDLPENKKLESSAALGVSKMTLSAQCRDQECREVESIFKKENTSGVRIPVGALQTSRRQQEFRLLGEKSVRKGSASNTVDKNSSSVSVRSFALIGGASRTEVQFPKNLPEDLKDLNGQSFSGSTVLPEGEEVVFTSNSKDSKKLPQVSLVGNDGSGGVILKVNPNQLKANDSKKKSSSVYIEVPHALRQTVSLNYGKPKTKILSGKIQTPTLKKLPSKSVISGVVPRILNRNDNSKIFPSAPKPYVPQGALYDIASEEEIQLYAPPICQQWISGQFANKANQFDYVVKEVLDVCHRRAVLKGAYEYVAMKHLKNGSISHSRSLEETFNLIYDSNAKFKNTIPGLVGKTLYSEQWHPIVAALGYVESHLQPHQISSSGARGIWQLMSGTFASYAGKNVSYSLVHDPQYSTQIASRYLRDLISQPRWKGDYLYTVGSYNSGECGMVQAVNTSNNSLVPNNCGNGKQYDDAPPVEYWKVLQYNMSPRRSAKKTGSRLLSLETMNHIARVIGVSLIWLDPEFFGQNANPISMAPVTNLRGLENDYVLRARAMAPVAPFGAPGSSTAGSAGFTSGAGVEVAD